MTAIVKNIISLNSQVKKELEAWKRKSTSDIKLLGIDNSRLNFRCNQQDYSITVPYDYPNKDSGFIMIDYNELRNGYEFLSYINSYFMDKKQNLFRMLRHIDKKYNKAKKEIDKAKADSDSLLDYDIDSFDKEENILENFDFEELKIRSFLEKNLSNMKSPLSIENNKNAPILFKGTLPGVVLLNQFMDIRSTLKKNDNISINLIDDNVYYWKLCFKNFSNDNLNNGLNQYKNNKGIDFIEVHFSFHDRFYPGYPPFIKVIQPKLADSLMHRITNMRMVQFEYWNPTREIEFMINKLYKVLNENGKIDTDDETIDYSNNPSMVELDNLLAQLISLCDIKDDYEPLDADEDYVKVYDKKNNKPTNKGKNYWKSGVGYGHNDASSWDIDEYIRLQKEKDQQIQSILQRVLAIVQDTSFENLPIMYNIFQTSYMVQFFKSYLQGTTILEMNKHKDLYNIIFAILQYLANEDGIYLFYNKDDSKSLFTLLKNISIESKQVIKISKNSNNDEDDSELNLPLMANSIFDMIETPYITYVSKMEEFYKNKENNLVEKLHTDGNPDFIKYVETMNPLKYDMVPFLMDQYLYSKKSGTSNRKMSRRLASEFASLSTSLPIFYQSSIFVRVNEQNIRNIKVLITGPEDTPYDSGVFIFDVYIEDNYPEGPPKMYLTNTGGIRFNPNLYKNGKVCLTLLGTWNGQKGESWNINTSTLQQLFVSVQSQILVDMPVFNEPGHEKNIGNSKGDSQNFKYNQYIRYYNMCHAMIDIVENVDKYKEFKDVILNHFKLKKEYILKISKKWCEESKDLNGSLQHNVTNNKEMFENKIKKLEEVLNTIN